MNGLRGAMAGLALALLGACGSQAGPVATGPEVTLPAPNPGLLPTINARKAVGWPKGAGPVAPEGFVVTRYAEGLDHPRWLEVLPNGDVLAAQSSTERATAKGVEPMVANWLMNRAGALGASPNRVTLLRDADGDGAVDLQSTFLEGPRQPFGMAVIGETFYLGATGAVLAWPYTVGQTQLEGPGRKIADLPVLEEDNRHWTRALAAAPDGGTLYVAVGSASNIAEKGIEVEAERAAILAMNPDGSNRRIFAAGLRNPVGLAFEPVTGALWTAVNERDMLGDDLVPDYMTSVREGGFYGWPYAYWGGVVDARVQPQRPDLVKTALQPDYALGAHTASLGLTFYTAEAFPAAYRGGAFVGQHGSWNRSTPSGYKVVFVRFENGRPVGPAQDFLTGFLNARNEAQGRPVGVAVDRTGALLVADDVGGIIWRVAAKP